MSVMLLHTYVHVSILQQFVSDRKVDEEIGTTSRFVADPDELLPHIMAFGRGKVINTYVGSRCSC